MFCNTMHEGSVNVYICFEIRKSVVNALNADKIKPPSFLDDCCIFEKAGTSINESLSFNCLLWSSMQQLVVVRPHNIMVTKHLKDQMKVYR